MPLISFYNPWKHKKTRAFLMFSRGIEGYQWHEVGKERHHFVEIIWRYILKKAGIIPKRRYDVQSHNAYHSNACETDFISKYVQKKSFSWQEKSLKR